MPRFDASLTKAGSGVKQGGHGTGGLVDDLLDQAERVLGALAQPDECDVGSLPGGDRPDVIDFDLAGDHLVPKRGHDRRYQRQAILPLVRDQHTQMLGVPVAQDSLLQPTFSVSLCAYPVYPPAHECCSPLQIRRDLREVLEPRPAFAQATLELPLLDPQVARKLEIVAATGADRRS